MRNDTRTVLLWTTALAVVLGANLALAQDAEDLGPGGGAKTEPASGGGEKATEDPSTAEEGKSEGEGEGEGEKGKGGEKKPGGFFDNKFLFIMLGAIVLMYVFMGRKKRKQAAKRKDMLTNLKKGDKITTIGGIVGSVIEVREDEVTLKIDETNNTRVHVTRWAIRGVGDQAKSENPDDKK